MKLNKRLTKEIYEKLLTYLENSEEWQEKNNSFSYYRFSTQEYEFNLEIVSIYIHPEEPFDSSVFHIWLDRINPVALINYNESPIQIYGAKKVRESVDFYLEVTKEMINPSFPYFVSNIFKIYPENEECDPQISLERLIDVTKTNNWSWQEATEVVYNDITNKRDRLLDLIRKIPNENFLRVVGNLDLVKPDVTRIQKQFSKRRIKEV